MKLKFKKITLNFNQIHFNFNQLHLSLTKLTRICITCTTHFRENEIILGMPCGLINLVLVSYLT